jgi:hypothetical protein
MTPTCPCGMRALKHSAARGTGMRHGHWRRFPIVDAVCRSICQTCLARNETSPTEHRIPTRGAQIFRVSCQRGHYIS